MSYYYQANFRTRATARKVVDAVPESSLPTPVKVLIFTALEQMQPDTDLTFITVKASGHWDHSIEVRQCYFHP